MNLGTRTALRALFLLAAAAGTASAQSYINASNQIPQGPPFNNSSTENVDFADVDLDGDYDAACADGGDCCNDQSRMWINMGGAQGGTIGFFQDQTSTRFPASLKDSRDVDFVDVDADGDDDIYLSNTSQITNQSNSFWINMGGLQGGSAGFFQDQTQARWLNIGVNNGTTTFSSIAPTTALPSGGFIDWSCDCMFGDLNNDGSIDLMHSTYGGSFLGNVPSRLFLNNGSGFYEEHNPSHFQLSGLTINNGDPALWLEGTFQQGTINATGLQADMAEMPLGIELGDMDGDFDLDILHGSRNTYPRLFLNRLQETGTLIYRDVTQTHITDKAIPGDNYENEWGDLDQDGDLDIYGLNWGTAASGGLTDLIQKNDGTGHYGPSTVLPSSGGDDNEADWFDYNSDGFLDVFVSAFGGADRLYQNSGPPNWTLSNVTSSQLPGVPGIALGADSVDIDLDGDFDILVANDGGGADVLLKNINQLADTKAPYLPNIEDAPDRAPGPSPTVVRVQMYDNASWDVTRYNNTSLEYRVDAGAPTVVPMKYAGGNLFRGEIPGALVGVISYQAKSADEYGNTGLSPIKGYSSGVTCTGSIVTYCTSSSTSIGGCVAAIGGAGTPSVANPGGFTISSGAVPGGNLGIMYFSNTGQSAIPFGTHGGFICAAPPVFRSGSKASGGTTGACNGNYAFTLQDLMSSAPQLVVPGDALTAGIWFRDPPNTPDGYGLSNGIQFNVCP